MSYELGVEKNLKDRSVDEHFDTVVVERRLEGLDKGNIRNNVKDPGGALNQPLTNSISATAVPTLTTSIDNTENRKKR